MNSIRFSLIFYFLLLLGAALGGVAYFSYQSTQNALIAKERSTEQLLKKKLVEDKADTETKFDAKVLDKGLALGRKLVQNYHRIEPLFVLGVVANAPHTGGVWSLLSWAEAHQPMIQIQPRVPWRLTQINLDPRLQPLHGEDEQIIYVVEEGEYYQTYVMPPFFKGEPRKVQPLPHEASDSLGGFVWDLSRDDKEKAEQRIRRFEDKTLKSGKTVRRVTLRVEIIWRRLGLAVPPIPPLTEQHYQQLPPATRDNQRIDFKSPPPIYLQYGLDTANRDAALAKLASDLERDLSSCAMNPMRRERHWENNCCGPAWGRLSPLLQGGSGWCGLASSRSTDCRRP